MTTKTQAEKTKPVKSFRLRGVSVAVFENHTQTEGRDVTFHKVSVQKTYKEGEDFKTTTSLGRDDLPVVRMLLGRAWEFILEKEAAARNGEEQS